MNFKNKIILTLFILLAFILFFNINNVFAFSFTDNFGNVRTFEDPDDRVNLDYPWYAFQDAQSKSNEIRVVFCMYEDGFFYNSIYPYVYGCYYHGTYDLETGSLLSFGQDTRYPNSYNCIGSDVKADTHIIGSNTDIYTDKWKSGIFFQAPPPIVEGITIPALETAEQIPQAIATTLKILIPVGLIVLSVGLLIYLIKRMIRLKR